MHAKTVTNFLGFVSVLETARSLTTPKAKAAFLLDQLRARPYIRFYIYAAKDRRQKVLWNVRELSRMACILKPDEYMNLSVRGVLELLRDINTTKKQAVKIWTRLRRAFDGMPEAMGVLHAVLEQRLDLGLPTTVVNQMLTQSNFDPIPPKHFTDNPKPQLGEVPDVNTQLAVVICTNYPDCIIGAVLIDGMKAAHLQILPEFFRPFCNALRKQRIPMHGQGVGVSTLNPTPAEN